MHHLPMLRTIRKQRKLNREKLAELADCDVMTIRRAETGVAQGQAVGITLYNAVKIADALGVGMDDLLGRQVARGTSAQAEMARLLTTYQN